MPSTYSKLGWKCRRGMLELDLMLRYFLDHGYQALTEPEKETFEVMLEQPDPVLYRWLLAAELPEDPDFHALVLKINAARAES